MGDRGGYWLWCMLLVEHIRKVIADSQSRNIEFNDNILCGARLWQPVTLSK